METSLEKVRDSLGYKFAKDFADMLKINYSTYLRYENDPMKMTLKSACYIADKTHLPVDVIIGRSELSETDISGKVQRFYDELSPTNKALVDEFMRFIAQREAQAAEDRQDVEKERYVKAASFLDRLFLQTAEQDESLGETVVFGSRDEVRSQFKRFAEEKALKRRAKQVENYATKLKASLTEPEGETLCHELEIDPTSTDEATINERVHQRAVKHFDDQDGSIEREVMPKIMDAYDKITAADSDRTTYALVNLP